MVLGRRDYVGFFWEDLGCERDAVECYLDWKIYGGRAGVRSLTFYSLLLMACYGKKGRPPCLTPVTRPNTPVRHKQPAPHR